MPVFFPVVAANNVLLRGSLAAPKQRFGANGRYAVAPVHTRSGALEWFVWDAEHPLSDTSHAEVIRQAASLAEAMDGLDLDDEAVRIAARRASAAQAAAARRSTCNARGDRRAGLHG